jgi:hypothetical protein
MNWISRLEGEHMQAEWLYDEETPIEVQEYEVFQAIDEIDIDQRLADGFAILCMN